MKLDLGGLNNGLQRYIINDSDLQIPVEIPHLTPHPGCLKGRLGSERVYHGGVEKLGSSDVHSEQAWPVVTWQVLHKGMVSWSVE